MRTQGVVIVSVTTTSDDYGNETTTKTEEPIMGALFEPAQSVERTDSRSPGVVTPAKFYLPVARDINADDLILYGGHTWQVVGASVVWDDQTEVPVKRTSAV